MSCCYSRSIHLTMMFLYGLLPNWIIQYDVCAAFRSSFYLIDVCFLFWSFTSCAVCLLGPYNLLGTDRIVSMNVWLFGWYWLWACVNICRLVCFERKSNINSHTAATEKKKSKKEQSSDKNAKCSAITNITLAPVVNSGLINRFIFLSLSFSVSFSINLWLFNVL